MIREMVYYARMALGIRALVRQKVPADPMAEFEQQMARRQEHFLDLAQRIVFANQAHPYHELFRIAGCTHPDLIAEVERAGLEPTLEKLAAEGVYLTHDEFKGKTPLVRGGREIPCTPEILLNPLVRAHMRSPSSGSRSSGTMTPKSTQFMRYRDAYHHLQWREFDLGSRTHLQVRPILPSTMGFGNNLRNVRMGRPPAKWFTQADRLHQYGHYRAMTHFLVRMAGSMGAAIPLPEYLPGNDFTPVARWIAERKQQGLKCAMRSYVSPAVRVAAEAQDAGLDISGTLFLVDGEALTESKQATIEAAGCEAFPKYAASEVGSIGSACRQMRSGNTVHVHREAVAVISRRKRAPLSDVEVNSLMFTNLLPFAARFLINAEMDDAGILEPANCDCEFSRAGMHMQIRGVYSYGKLTGQGITLMGSDLLRILEKALPNRFGGAPGDYQLVEYEGGCQTQVELRISPRVGARTPDAARDFLLSEIRACYGGALASRVWTHSGGLKAVIAEPFATRTGKVLALHLLGPKAEIANAS